MDHIRKEIRRALLICVPYIVIVFFLDDLDKMFYRLHSRLANPLLVLYLLIATVIIFALLIHEVIDVKKNYATYGKRTLLPLVIYLIALVNSFWSPLRISSEVFKSKIIYRAYRRSHFGHDLLKMHANGKLDIRYPGMFGLTDWEYGMWTQKGDTFYLKYEKGWDTILAKPDTLVRSADGTLIPAGIPPDTLSQYRSRFFRMPVMRRK